MCFLENLKLYSYIIFLLDIAILGRGYSSYWVSGKEQGVLGNC